MTGNHTPSPGERLRRVVVTAVVVLGVAGALTLRERRRQTVPGPARPAPQSPVLPADVEIRSAPDGRDTSAAPGHETQLPRLLELGGETCINCIMMAPVLKELRAEYGARLKVEFIDVIKDKQAAKEHGVRLVPTQVFYDGQGNERFRHEGFFPKADILAKWQELGVDLGQPASPPRGPNPGESR